MQSFINEITGQFSRDYFFSQFITIVLFWLYGYILIKLLYRGKSRDAVIMRALLAFPLALSVYGITGFITLAVGIPFGNSSVVGEMALVLIIAVFLNTRAVNTAFSRTLKTDLIVTGAVILIALISVSGFISISISNDSMYYYHMYPNAIVYFKSYREAFDTFLTDEGQGTAIINTLPAMFGFDEAFGIQTFFNIDFILFFTYSVYDKTRTGVDKKTRIIITGLAFFSLVTAMPFIVISKWAIANIYFMEYMFMVVWLMMRYEGVIGENRGRLFVTAFLFLMLSLLRVEGAMFAAMLILCFTTLRYSNKELVLYFLLPAGILQIAYYTRIYYSFSMKSETNFMSQKNLLLMLLFYAIILLYLLFIRGKTLLKIQEHFGWFLVFALITVNAGLFILDRSLYIANLKAFYGNLLHQSGWSIFPVVIIAGYILLYKKEIKMNLFDLIAVCYIFMTIALCFARQGEMRESYADSGNRVLLQVVPLFIFALTLRAVDRFKDEPETQSESL